MNFIRSTDFDLLLCDLNIEQERDGFNVIRAMRSANPDCVTVILTGYPDFDSAVEGIRCQVDDYLMKPTDVDALLALLDKKLAARSGQAR